MSGQYDNARHHVRHILSLAGDAAGNALLTSGTNTAAVEIIRVRIPRKITIDEVLHPYACHRGSRYAVDTVTVSLSACLDDAKTPDLAVLKKGLPFELIQEEILFDLTAQAHHEHIDPIWLISGCCPFL